MSTYMTEDEQWEAIKSWWRKNQNWVTILLSVTLLVIAGFRYWNWHLAKLSQQASVSYEQMMVAYANQDNKGTRAFARELIQNHPESVYADAAHLTLAKLDVNKGKYRGAKSELLKVKSRSALHSIAQIRLAKLYMQDKKYDEAINTLMKVSNTSYASIVNELKGDVYRATGRYGLALENYRKAEAQIQSSGVGNLFLEMKTNDLASRTQSKADGLPSLVMQG